MAASSSWWSIFMKNFTFCCRWAWWPYLSWNVGERPLTRSSSGWRCPFWNEEKKKKKNHRFLVSVWRHLKSETITDKASAVTNPHPQTSIRGYRVYFSLNTVVYICLTSSCSVQHVQQKKITSTSCFDMNFKNILKSLLCVTALNI